MNLCSQCKDKEMKIGRLCIACQKKLVKERFEMQKECDGKKKSESKKSEDSISQSV